MAGQYLVLAGYALLPWLARAVWRLLECPTWRRAAAVTAWTTAIGLVSLHALAPAAVVGIAIAIAPTWGRWGRGQRALGYLAAAAGAWLVINAFWLVPLLLGHGRQAQIIAGAGPDQQAAYATAAGSFSALGPLGVPLNLLTLQGFWADAYGRYLLPTAGPLFWLCAVIILVLVGAGLWAALRGGRPSLRRGSAHIPATGHLVLAPTARRLALALAAAGCLGWLLAIGGPWQNLPLLRGYREPHKWTMLLALGYAMLAPFGALALSRVVQNRPARRPWLRQVLPGLTLILPLLWVPMLYWGAAGQLHSAQYPAGWSELNRRLNALPAGRIVVLPWHQYIALDFAHRTVANPAPRFFDRPVISSDDPELMGVAQTSPNPTNRAVQNILNQHFYMTDAGPQFAAAGIRYLVLLKQADWRSYGWLDVQDGLTLRADTPDYQLYEVTAAP
jgi:hypothetical protein